jgi:hypothetical protein
MDLAVVEKTNVLQFELRIDLVEGRREENMGSLYSWCYNSPDGNSKHSNL